MMSAPRPPLRRYRFEDLILDTGQRRLWRGDEQIRLSKLTFDFLLALVEAAPNLLTQDQLAKAVWGPQRVITPENVSQRLKMLRRALGEQAERPRYIEAVRGQGYRLMPGVEIAIAEPAVDQTGPKDTDRKSARVDRRFSRLLFAAAGGALTVLASTLGAWSYFSLRASEEEPPGAKAELEAPRTIIVLPFVNQSSDPEQRYFSDGLTDELIIRLERLPRVSVQGRTTSFSFRDSKRSAAEIAAAVGVQHVLEGSVARADSGLRIRVQLSDASGFVVWADAYNRPLTSIFAIQHEIVRAVAHQLQVELGLDRAAGEGGTVNFEAYQFYLAALRDKPGEGDGLDHLNHALDIDPKFAKAWMLKSVFLGMRAATDGGKASLDEAEAAARRAIALAPDRGDGYNARAFVLDLRGEWLRAERDWQRASELGFADIRIYPNHLMAAGRFERAREVVAELLAADLLNDQFFGFLMEIDEILGDRESADDVYRDGRELFHPWGFGETVRSWSLLSRRETDPLHENPSRAGVRYAKFAELIEEPERALEMLHDAAAAPDNQDPTSSEQLAIWAAYFGDTRTSLRLLERSVAGWPLLIQHAWLGVFAEVRQLPEFKELLIDIGLVEFWRETGWPDICRPTVGRDFECD